MATFQTGYGNFYEFSFEKLADGSYRTYILSQPSYGGRDTGCSVIHRLSANDRYYICRKPEPRSLEEARKTAAGWATRTDRYILTGRKFDE